MELINPDLTNIKQYLQEDEVSIIFKFVDGEHLAVTIQQGPLKDEDTEEIHAALIQAMLNITTLPVEEIMQHAEDFARKNLAEEGVEDFPVAGHA